MALDDWLLERARVKSSVRKRIKMDDKMSFFQQLSTLVTSGTPLFEALQMSAEQSRSLPLREALHEVAGQVAAGNSLHGAMESHRGLFSDHWIELVRVGEVSGNLGPVLNDLNNQIRESREARRQLVAALIYPCVMLVIALMVVAVMLWFVVPTFAGMFREMNAELPGITKAVMSASDFLVAYGLWAIGGLIAGVVALRQYVKTDAGLRRMSALGLATPMLGDLMVQSNMHRFASNLALLLKSGVPMLETLSTLSAVFRTNPLYRDAIMQAHHRVAAGRPLADSLEETGLFTEMVTNMVRIGEESAQLAPVMEELAPYYKEKVQMFMAKFTKMMEPAIIVLMGGIVSVVMTAIYIPMFDMAGAVK